MNDQLNFWKMQMKKAVDRAQLFEVMEKAYLLTISEDNIHDVELIVEWAKELAEESKFCARRYYKLLNENKVCSAEQKK